MPLGEWRYDEDSGAWIFDPYVPLGTLPQTGQPLLLTYSSALLGFAMLLAGLITQRVKKRKAGSK